MASGRQLIFLISLFILSGCATLEQPAPTAVFDAQETAPEAPPIEPAPQEVEATREDPQPTASTASPRPSPSASPDPLPEPTLFNISWSDREPFRAGLLASEQGIVDELSGASVYHMQLSIADLTTVDGRLEVLYTNQEAVPLNEIYFHLFADQLGGSIKVSDVTVNGQQARPEREENVLRVPLAPALTPGEKVVVGMTFVTTVPPEDGSTKYNILAFNDDILALAHFYPMIATYDERGWQTKPSPPNGDETYADMSYYLLQLTAPAEQVVVATGLETARNVAGKSQSMTIAAGPVRDLYLAMSDRYEVISDEVDGVQINSYAPAELLPGAALALDVAVEAVRSFGERYGPYPYQELDIVGTPTRALGIEYPGLFANAIRIYDVTGSASSGTPNRMLLESTTAHETAHQWFYNLVGNDQLNEPWLDEATTQYATWMYYLDRYGEKSAAGFYDSLRERWARTDFADIPIGMAAGEYSGLEYGAIVYGRGPIFLDELAQKMGQGTFDAFLRDYVDTYRWQIASSEDFQALAEKHCQCDLSGLFDKAVYAN